MNSYKIVFRGEVKSGFSKESRVPMLCKFLNVPIEKGDLLFSGKSFALKKGVEREKALKIYNALDKLGIVTHLIGEENITEEISSQEESSISSRKQICPHCGKHLLSAPKKQEEIHETDEYSDVKPAWRQIFKQFDSVGGRTSNYFEIKKHPTYRNFSFSEKLRIDFSIWALLFGPFYYFYRGMWSKAFLIVAACCLGLSALNLMAGLMKPSLYNIASSLLIPVVTSQLAKYDYYRYKVLNESVYRELPEIFQNKIVIALFFLVSLILVVSTDPEFQQF